MLNNITVGTIFEYTHRVRYYEKIKYRNIEQVYEVSTTTLGRSLGEYS